MNYELPWSVLSSGTLDLLFLIHNPLIFKRVTRGLQTRLVCTQKKPCFDSKEALFERQTRLLFLNIKST